MVTRSGVLAGVAVGGGVAAQRDAAGLAGPQVHPRRARFRALFALVRLGSLDGLDGIDVRAGAHALDCVTTLLGICVRSLRPVVRSGLRATDRGLRAVLYDSPSGTHSTVRRPERLLPVADTSRPA
jgi:hypothetical protein